MPSTGSRNPLKYSEKLHASVDWFMDPIKVNLDSGTLREGPIPIMPQTTQGILWN